MKKISVISAPLNLGLRPNADGTLSGVTALPRVLLENDLLKKLDADFQFAGRKIETSTRRIDLV